MADRTTTKISGSQDDLGCLETITKTELRYCGYAGAKISLRVRAAARRCVQQRQQQSVDETLTWSLGDDGSPYREVCKARPDIAEWVASLHKASLSGRQREGTGMRPRSGLESRLVRQNIYRRTRRCGQSGQNGLLPDVS